MNRVAAPLWVVLVGATLMFSPAVQAENSTNKAAQSGFFSKLKKRYSNRSTLFGKLVRLRHSPVLVTAKEAVASIQPGETVFTQIGHGAAHAVLNEVLNELLREVSQPKSRFSVKNPVKIMGLSNTGSRKLFSMDPKRRGRVHPISLFLGANVRDVVNAGFGDWVPIHLGEIPAAFRNGDLKVDKALIKVSPPDRAGYVTLGASVAVTPAAMDAATEVIAVVNEHVPRTNGAARIHISQIDKLVFSDEPLHGLPPSKIGPAEQRIADHVLKILRRNQPKKGRRTFQFGIGGVPDAIAKGLVKAKTRINIVSEMIADGTLAAVEGGIVPDPVKYTFFMGTDAGLRKLHNNNKLRAYPTEAINDPAKIAKIPNFTAINGAVEADLYGAVNAQMIDNQWYSGVGGQQDFARGAHRSEGGLAINVLDRT
ncbi:MAG: hypothetical protein JRH20_12640 [Deltaproteobacteria bacterium]|nr:hypothetical protein [Deltaproteobacteria bacterium]